MDMHEVNQGVIEKFRAGEDPSGMHRDRLLLLTTTGARTGEPHICPMMFHYTPSQDGSSERVLVIASADAAPADPQWYRNLLANPAVRVEMPDEAFEATAVPLEGEDYAQEWREIKAFYPFFAEHEAKVDRQIPVVELRRN